MRIVLDTNVVMSALLWRGTPYRLLAAIRQRPSAQLFSSTALLEELADVRVGRATTMPPIPDKAPVTRLRRRHLWEPPPVSNHQGAASRNVAAASVAAPPWAW